MRRIILQMLALGRMALLPAMVSAWRRGIDVTCGCFGPASCPGLISRGLIIFAGCGLLAVGVRDRYKGVNHAS